jgi:glycosyltransferase involved in cell wall biosynthesis
MNISKKNSKGKNLRIGILTQDFLNLSGARDLLRMIIRGLKFRNENEFFLLMDNSEAEFDLQSNLNPQYVWWQRIVCKVRTNLRKNTKWLYFFPKTKILSHKAENLLGKNVIDGLNITPYSGMPNGFNNTISKYKIDVIIPTLTELPTPFVSYLYDCQHKYFPQNFSTSDISLRDKLFQKLIDSSCSLIVNSKDTKKDLIKFFKVDEKKIIALPFAPQLEKEVLEEYPEVRKKYHLPDKYFLISNQFWIHKSLETALNALKLLIDKGLYDCHVVFTGKMKDSRFPEYVSSLLRLVKDLNLENHTTFLGYIPKRDQLEIMKNSCAVIQTTLFEGGPGGGAIYDAVSLGVRSIVSDISVNKELPVSNSLLLFETKNSRDLAEKMILFWNENYIRPDSLSLLRAHHNSLSAFSDTLYTAINLALKAQKS